MLTLYQCMYIYIYKLVHMLTHTSLHVYNCYTCKFYTSTCTGIPVPYIQIVIHANIIPVYIQTVTHAKFIPVYICIPYTNVIFNKHLFLVINNIYMYIKVHCLQSTADHTMITLHWSFIGQLTEILVVMNYS